MTDGTIARTKDLITRMQSVVPTDTQFQAAFATASVSKVSLARYYLLALERQTRGEKDLEFVPAVKEYETKHPLPRVRLAPIKPPTQRDLERRRNVVDSILELRQEIGATGIPAEELIRQVREETEDRD